MATGPSRFTPALGGALDDAPGWLRALLAALEGAFVSLVLAVLPVFLVWLASPNISVGGGRAFQLGLAGWCLAHGGAVHVGIGTLSLMPLLFTLVCVVTATWSAARLAAGLSRGEPRRLAWSGGLRRDVALEGAVFVGSYTLLGMGAAALARTSDFAPSLPRSLLGFLTVAVVAYGLGLRAEFRGDLGTVAPGWSLRKRLPAWWRAGWGAGLRAVAWLLLAGLLLVFLLLVVRFDRVATLYGALSPGILGGIVLTGTQALFLPNFAVWALSWLAGPGFGVGTDSAVTLTSSQPGLMPLVPFLGALPEPGPLPVVLRAALLLPVAAGGYLEWRSSRAVGRDPLDRALAAASGCLVAGCAAAVAAWFASGALGSARLADVGVSPFLLGAVLGGELVLGAAIGLIARLAGLRLRLQRPAPSADGGGAGRGASTGAGPVARPSGPTDGTAPRAWPAGTPRGATAGAATTPSAPPGTRR